MSHYKPYPQSNLIREWDKLIKLSKKEVTDIYEQWEEIKLENEATSKRLYEEKSTKLKEVSDFLMSAGVDVFKYKKSGFFPQKNGYQAWYQKNVVDKISEKYSTYFTGMPYAHMTSMKINDVTVSNNQSPTNIVELYERITWQYKNGLSKLKQNDKLLIKSVEYATTHGIDIEDFNSDDIIGVVLEHAKDAYLREELPDGSEVYLKHACQDCSEYIMGEHRCSCGNRRISITVEGDLLSGFEYYPEAH